MFKNYLKIALRQLRKQKMYSAVKIAGFGLSIAACILIALYIKDELSYDKSWVNADRLYRVLGEYDNNGKIESGNDWPAPMAKALQEDYPEIEKSGRLMDAPSFYGASSNQLRAIGEEQNNFEQGFTYFDQDLLDMLQIPMVYGDRKKALSEPQTMVISKAKADKYYPNQNPVGKIMVLNNNTKEPYRIGGVMQDFPKNSHLQYDFLLTMTGHEFWPGEQSTWMASNYPTYILLKAGADPAKLQSKLNNIISKYFIPTLKESGEKMADDLLQKAKIFIQPVPDVHLHSSQIDDRLEKGDIKLVWLFGAIAIFILAIATINFVNLSTAKSANRAKEVGLRKVVGSYRSSLVKQFLTESMLYSVLSFLLGLLMAVAALPVFNIIAAKSLSVPWTSWWFLPVLILAAALVGIMAGLYPSFYLSSFRPINVLKGQLSLGTKNSILRNGMVIFQFTTSIILIIGTIIIYKQTRYLLTRRVGFDKDQVLLVQGSNTLENNITAFKNDLLKSAAVRSVSVSDYLPIAGMKRDGNTFWKKGRMKEDIGVFAQKWVTDCDYLKTIGMQMKEGRYFSKEMASDSAATVINQTMADKLGLKNPIGQQIQNGWQTFTVIGVVNDFNFESMRQDVSPLCLILGNYNSSIVSVKIAGDDVRGAIRHVAAVWKVFSPNQPFRYSFLDENFERMYRDVRRVGSIFTSFAILAIIIACLGLFALSAFMAEQRNKEIGIRKVLGASVRGITAMLSKGFVKLVMISIVIASPVAYWAMTRWLQDFAYRISISWWMITVAGAAAVLIALVTVSFQSITAARASPVKSLRSE